MELEARKIEEREFHNKLREVTDDAHVADTRWSPEMESTIKNNRLWANMKYYSVERASRKFVLDWFEANCPGKTVLDFCCGNGQDGVLIAQMGAERVVGLDISDVSIDNCRKLAESEGVADRTEYAIGDAEATDFEDDSFDVVTEYGSLHHVDLEKTYAELARIVRPGGKVICNEALAHNPVIHLYRKMTPHLRTPWEVQHILKKPQIQLAEKYFERVEPHFFHLFTLLGVPFRKLPGFGVILSALEALDGLALRVPGLRWQAWQVVFTLEGPRKDAVAAATAED